MPRDVVQKAPVTALRVTSVAKENLRRLAELGWLEALPEGTIIHGSKRREAWRIIRPNALAHGDATPATDATNETVQAKE